MGGSGAGLAGQLDHPVECADDTRLVHGGIKSRPPRRHAEEFRVNAMPLRIRSHLFGLHNDVEEFG